MGSLVDWEKNLLLEHISIESLKIEKERVQRLKNTGHNNQGLWDTDKKV